MSTPPVVKTYPYIVSNPHIAGGEPIIENTRITVRCIAGYYQMGMDVDEILQQLPHLTASQAHSALAYYFDHQTEIDQAIRRNADIDYWKTQVQAHPQIQSS